MVPLYKIMKKSYTNKKRTTIALDPDMTKRIEKVLKNSGGKLSKYARKALTDKLEEDEMKQTRELWNKLNASSQYQKIKQLEGEVKKLKEYHITEKKLDEKFKMLKSKRIDDLSKKIKEIEDAKENETRWLELSMARLKDTEKFVGEIMKAMYDGTAVMVSEDRMEGIDPGKEKSRKEFVKKLEKATGKKYKVPPTAITKEMLVDAEKLWKKKKE